jgi:hypothetical protein
LVANVKINTKAESLMSVANSKTRSCSSNQLRWDRANIASYCNHTRSSLESIVSSLDAFTEQFDNIDLPTNIIVHFIDQTYERIVNALNEAATLYVPQVKKNFFIILVG